MSRGRFAAIAAALCLLAGAPARVSAAPVLVLSADGRVVATDDPFLVGPSLTPAPAAAGPRATTARGPTVRAKLAKLRRTGAISSASYSHYLHVWSAAAGTERRLTGTRAVELGAVIQNVRQIAAARLLSASRLPALFKTLDSNRRWWSTGSLLSSGARVEFSGSQLVWEYYPRQGIELQELGSFGKADGLYTAGHSHYAQMRQLLGELIPLAARRAGVIAWEYYFSFDGGTPPWTSAMSQGTALEALTRASRAFHSSRYLEIGRRALPVFRVAPARGVAVRTRRGARYLLYSFAPGAKVLNGFLQSLIGLYDYAHASHDGTAARLFAAGDREARFELPSYDTGSWSLYQPGVLDSRDYHALVTGFLHELCDRTHRHAYCRMAARFDGYARHPPPGV